MGRMRSCFGASMVFLCAAFIPLTGRAQYLEAFKDGNSGRPVFWTNDVQRALRAQSVGKTPAQRSIIKHKIRKGKFRDSVLVSDEFLETNKTRLGISDVSKNLAPLEPKKDKLGKTHVRYLQQYRGLRVIGGEMIVHLDRYNQIYAMSAKYAEKIRAPKQAIISEAKAKKLARAAMKKDLALESKPVVYAISRVILHKGVLENTSDTTSYLAFEVKLRAEEYGRMPEDSNYYIDSQTGEVVKSLSNVQKAIYRKIYDCTTYPWAGWCSLINQFPDSCPNCAGYTFGRREDAASTPRGPNPVYGGVDIDSLFDFVGEVHNFYFQIFGLNGGNNQGGMGIGTPSYEVGMTKASGYLEAAWPSGWCPNATFLQGQMNFCKGLALRDVVGHEYAHGVLYFRFNQQVMSYAGESGALDESFADIMGEVSEKFSTGSTNWIHGPIGMAGYWTRSLSDPPSMTRGLDSLPSPDKLYADTYYCDRDDNGGVHINSTVVSKGFYLMAEGTQGQAFNGCTITGIGIEKMEQILYHAATSYWTLNETFNEAYHHAKSACRDLGYSTTECAQVEAALQAVELNQSRRCSGGTEAVPACSNRCPSDPADSDGDGTRDCLDECPSDPAKTVGGHCGCGKLESSCEWCEETAGGVQLSDGTSILNSCLFGRYVKSYSCNGASYMEGRVDCGTEVCVSGQCVPYDGCPGDPLKTDPGICGCSVSDTDTDSDGTPDCLDGCPTDPAKTAAGHCGCGNNDNVCQWCEQLSNGVSLSDGTVLENSCLFSRYLQQYSCDGNGYMMERLDCGAGQCANGQCF